MLNLVLHFTYPLLISQTQIIFHAYQLIMVSVTHKFIILERQFIYILMEVLDIFG